MGLAPGPPKEPSPLRPQVSGSPGDPEQIQGLTHTFWKAVPEPTDLRRHERATSFSQAALLAIRRSDTRSQEGTLRREPALSLRCSKMRWQVQQ